MNGKFEGKFGKKLRGVNLGGWLVLESWMTPSLFAGLTAVDETSYSVELGIRAESMLRQHWETFITEDDFRWLSSVGINAVRIPVGHWILDGDYPDHWSYKGIRYPYVKGGLNILDRAFEWAERHELLVMLDLHCAPGCQNGFDNGGIKDVVEWHTREDYRRYALDVLEELAKRYQHNPALHALEVLNEPHWNIPTGLLKEYNGEAYQRIRKHCKAGDVAVVFNDGFRPYTEWIGFLREPQASNVIFDIHRYQCFDRKDMDMDIYGHIQKASIEWKNEADAIIGELGLWTVVGEWSLGLDLKTVSLWAPGPYNHAYEHMDRFQFDCARRAYGASQLLSFEKYLGWFFWSYKTETTPEWCFRRCVEKGWLPAHFE